jgi:hypothetical protein
VFSSSSNNNRDSNQIRNDHHRRRRQQQLEQQQDQNQHHPKIASPYKTTIVTSIFSPLSSSALSTLASIKDPLIVFVSSPDLVSTVTTARLRYDPMSERTQIVSITTKMSPVSRIVENADQRETEKDVDIKLDTSTIASLSKPWFLKEATRIDPFQSSYFIFMDNHVFEIKGLITTQQPIVTHPNVDRVIPPFEVLFNGCSTVSTDNANVRTSKNINSNLEPWKDSRTNLFIYHSNTIMAGRKQSIRMYYDAYIKILKRAMIATNKSTNNSYNQLSSLIHSKNKNYGTIDNTAVTQSTCSQFPLSCVHLVQAEPLSSSNECQSSSSSSSSSPKLFLSALKQDNATSTIINRSKLWTITAGFKELNEPLTTPIVNNHERQQPTEDKLIAGSLPSAKTLLNFKPPFDDSDLIKLEPSGNLLQSPNTVVTGYFRISSKYVSSEYDKWMANMLSLQDAMVIFTEPSFVEQIKGHRQHALDRTVIVPIELKDLPYGSLYPASFWKDQMDRNPEKKRHRSVELFWIWLSKTWCITEAIRLNLYNSDFFVWSDIGCFRNKMYNGMTMIEHRDTVPKDRIVQMAHRTPMVLDDPIFNDKYKQKSKHFHSGSQFAGYKDTMIRFHELFLETIDVFLERNMIIVDDQLVAQSCCLSHPDLCAYLPSDQIYPKDNRYFGLRYMLHYGDDKIKLWYPSSPSAKANTG